MGQGIFGSLIFLVALTQGALSMSAALAADQPFSISQKGVCEFAVDQTQTHRSLRSLYSCADKVIIITNTGAKTAVYDAILLNEGKCKNHLFLDGQAEGPVKADEQIVIVTTCDVARVDLKIDNVKYSHRF